MTDAEKFKKTLLDGLAKRLSSYWDHPSWEGKPEEQATDIVDWIVTVHEMWSELEAKNGQQNAGCRLLYWKKSN